MCCGNEAGWYWRLIDSFIAQLEAPGPSRICNESKEEEEEEEDRPVGSGVPLSSELGTYLTVKANV